jgi:hypothetical protein
VVFFAFRASQAEDSHNVPMLDLGERSNLAAEEFQSCLVAEDLGPVLFDCHKKFAASL